MLLLGKPIIKTLKKETKQYVKDHNLWSSYVAIFLLSDDKPSEIYVQMKSEYAKKIWMSAKIFFGKDRWFEETAEEIMNCNHDDACVGIIVQLPVAEQFQQRQQELLDMILPEKDIDGLWWSTFWLSGFGSSNFLWATPKAVFEILKHYELDEFRGKTVMIIWQSNLIGKPLIIECMKRGATVISCNSKTDSKVFHDAFRSADFVFSATWVYKLIWEEFIEFSEISDNEKKELLSEKVLVDIWRWLRDGKAHGDIDRVYFEDKVKAVTPVPGGVGPVVVAGLFHNVIR